MQPWQQMQPFQTRPGMSQMPGMGQVQPMQHMACMGQMQPMQPIQSMSTLQPFQQTQTMNQMVPVPQPYLPMNPSTGILRLYSIRCPTQRWPNLLSKDTRAHRPMRWLLLPSQRSRNPCLLSLLSLPEQAVHADLVLVLDPVDVVATKKTRDPNLDTQASYSNQEQVQKRKTWTFQDQDQVQAP